MLLTLLQLTTQWSLSHFACLLSKLLSSYFYNPRLIKPSVLLIIIQIQSQSMLLGHTFNFIWPLWCMCNHEHQYFKCRTGEHARKYAFMCGEKGSLGCSFWGGLSIHFTFWSSYLFVIPLVVPEDLLKNPVIDYAEYDSTLMSLVSWYDSLPFYFCILVFLLWYWLTIMHGTDTTPHTITHMLNAQFLLSLYYSCCLYSVMPRRGSNDH